MERINKYRFPIIICLFFLFLFFWTNPDIKTQGTIKIWDRYDTSLYESAGTVGRKNPVVFEKFPKHLLNAVIAVEDENFWSNPGVDIKANIRALVQNLQKGKIISGGSTITQQLARSAVINDVNPNRSIFRKIREILIALRLNIAYSKKAIITKYLNEMYFGNMTYGVQAAAEFYFGKDVSELSLAESALLAGLISSPGQRDPLTQLSHAKKRQTQVLQEMADLKKISDEEEKLALNEKLSIIKNAATINAPHFVQYVLEDIKKLNVKNERGINVYTTLDYPLYRFSEKITKKWIEENGNYHDMTNAAMVMLDNKTGEVLNMLGGVDFFDATNSGEVNMVTAPRQPGSALKPITYAVSFMKGYTPATLIFDIKQVFKTKKNEGYTPYNYDGKFHGPVLAREALASSLNLPAVEILNRIGLSSFIKTARDLGLKSLLEDDRYDLSLTLGGGEVSLLELVNVYASFARNGQFKNYYVIEKMTDDYGNSLYKHKEEKEIQVLGKNSREIAYLIADILSDPKARMLGFGEKNALVMSRPVAVKTGTTTDWHDNWTVGFTPSYTVGVWVGNNDNHPMRDISGVTGAAPLWNQFFEEFLKGKPREEFKKPDTIIEKVVCTISGQLDDSLCPEKNREIFIKGTEPVEKSKTHKRVLIDIRNNLLATDLCPKIFVIEKVMVEYPEKLFSWAKENDKEIIPQEYSPYCESQNPGKNLSFVTILNPKNKAVFENSPDTVYNQKIVFEAGVSSDIKTVIWYLDGQKLSETNRFPFSFSWPLQLGEHAIMAIAETGNGKKIYSEKVKFTVVDAKQGY